RQRAGRGHVLFAAAVKTRLTLRVAARLVQTGAVLVGPLAEETIARAERRGAPLVLGHEGIARCALDPRGARLRLRLGDERKVWREGVSDVGPSSLEMEVAGQPPCENRNALVVVAVCDRIDLRAPVEHIAESAEDLAVGTRGGGEGIPGSAPRRAALGSP